MNYKIIKSGLIFLITLIALFIFRESSFIKANAKGWVKVNNSWRYYSDPDVETGWYKSNGSWYYLDEEGAAKTGWIKSEGKYYYLDLYRRCFLSDFQIFMLIFRIILHFYSFFILLC